MANVFDAIEFGEGCESRKLSQSEMKSKMLRLAPKAFARLEEKLYCGNDKVETEAALGILDRCGFGPQAKLMVTDEREDLSDLSTVEIAARAAQLAKALLEQNNEEPEHKQPFDVH
jgi:hypothetical protein